MKSILQICFVLGLLPLFSNFSTFKNDERGPLITATGAATMGCKLGNSCASGQFSTKKWHGVKITLTGASISYYNSNFVYSVYAGTNPYAAGAQLIGTFPCTKNVVEFVNSALLDNTTYSVRIKDAQSSNEGMVTFTTGTGRGSTCIQKVDAKDRN